MIKNKDMEEVLEQKKNKVHQLINTIDDEMELDFLVNAFQKYENQKHGNIWNSLTEKQKQEVLQADIESENEDNLIDFEDLKKLWLIK
jgi:hypothetical protein